MLYCMHIQRGRRIPILSYTIPRYPILYYTILSYTILYYPLYILFYTIPRRVSDPHELLDLLCGCPPTTITITVPITITIPITITVTITITIIIIITITIAIAIAIAGRSVARRSAARRDAAAWWRCARGDPHRAVLRRCWHRKVVREAGTDIILMMMIMTISSYNRLVYDIIV